MHHNIKIYCIILLAFVLLFGCSTKNAIHDDHYPPNLEYITKIKNDLKDKIAVNTTSISEQDKAWALAYLAAQNYVLNNQQESACTKYKELFAQEEFPLKDLAWVRSLETCKPYAHELVEIWQKKDRVIPNWLTQTYLETSLKLAHHRQLSTYITFFSTELAKQKKVRAEVKQLLEGIISYAEATTDKTIKSNFFQELYKVSPRLAQQNLKHNMYNIARDFEFHRQFKDARKLYQKIINNSSISFLEKMSAWERLRMTYKLERNNASYLIQTQKQSNFIKKELSKKPTDPILQRAWFNIQLNLARTEWNKHNNAKAQNILNKLLKFPSQGPDMTALIYQVLAGIAIEEKHNDDAINFLDLALKENIRDVSFLDELRWRKAWALFMAEKYQDAIESFKILQENSQNFYTTQRVKYWMAQAFFNVDKKDLAWDIWEEIYKDDPFGYYGALANRAMKQTFSPLENKTVEINFDDIPDATLAWLIAMDETSEAQKHLRNSYKRYTSNREMEKVLPLFYFIGDYNHPMALISAQNPEQRNDLLNQMPFLFYPLPFTNIVRDTSKTFSVPAAHIYSIMRQESAFNKNARSPADAYGLMQVIPETAKHMAKKYNITYNDVEDMYDPKIAIQLGAAYIKEMAELFPKDFVLQVASYNASKDAVSNWKQKRFDGDYAKFIENIPYEETRNYVKHIIRNYITYLRLEKSIPFAFPEELLTEKK